MATHYDHIPTERERREAQLARQERQTTDATRLNAPMNAALAAKVKIALCELMSAELRIDGNNGVQEGFMTTVRANLDRPGAAPRAVLNDFVARVRHIATAAMAAPDYAQDGVKGVRTQAALRVEDVLKQEKNRSPAMRKLLALRAVIETYGLEQVSLDADWNETENISLQEMEKLFRCARHAS